MRFGLLLIDLQNDYLARPGLVPPPALVVPRVQRLLEGCRRRGVPVFRVETHLRSDSSNAMPHWRKVQRTDCLVGTRGAEPPPELAAGANEAVLAKPFFSAFDAPELDAFLAAASVDCLVVAGLYTHACVRDSVLAAYSRGYQVWIASDAIASPEPDHARLSLEFLCARAASLHSVQAILERMDTTEPTIDCDPGRTWIHRDPCDWSRVLYTVTIVEGTAIARLVAHARSNAEAWRRSDIRDRLPALRRWLALLHETRQELVGLLVTDVGKPVIDAEAEFNYALSLLSHTLEHLEVDETLGSSVRVHYCPLGVVGIITPWNNPLAIAVGKLAPALGFGNAVVWKPALQGSRIAACLARTIVAAGCGEALALLTGDAETGRRLASGSGIDALSFTGSIAVGEQLAKICAVSGIKFQAELGGNNPVLILEDVDPQSIVKELALAIFSFSGQRCTAPRRLLVANGIKDRFAAALRDAVAGLALGHPAQADVRVGPVISREAQQRMAALVATAKDSGGWILCGGSVPEAFQDGFWFEPTVLVDPDPAARVVMEESFGPLAVLLGVRDLAHGIALCNEVAHGLVATIYTDDQAAQRRFVTEVSAGIVGINQPRPQFDSAAPFSGWKASSIGMPEHGRWDRDFYTQTKAVYGSA